VIDRYEDVIRRRGRNEDASAVRYWKTTGITSPGGLVRERDLQLWIDWLVRAGELRAGDVTPAQVFTNEFNPFSKPRVVVSKTGE
jgi:hypothetical protein